MKTLRKVEQSSGARKLNETSVFINTNDQPPPTSASSLTSPIPDLKIDFFSETSAGKKKSPSTSPRVRGSRKKRDREEDDDVGNNNEVFAGENADAALERCQKDSLSTSSFSNKSSNSINVVSNPMSSAVVTTPRATIVVQQVNEEKIICVKASENFTPVYFHFSSLELRFYFSRSHFLSLNR